MFTVRINKLRVYTKIGVSIPERKKKQLLLVSIKFSYKVNNIKNADNIVVLDKGRIVETGNHNHLLNVKGIYSELWRVQAGSEINSI